MPHGTPPYHAPPMRPLLRLPCALLALLLSALGGARLAAYERHDMRAQALISRQVQALCGQPDVQSRLKFCN